jgi:hypothetical protein
MKKYPSYKVLTHSFFLKMRSQYTNMLLEWGDIPLSDILYAGIFQWLLLAGYMVLPGTFVSLQKSEAVQEGLRGNGAEEAVLHTIQNPPLLAIACVLFLVGLMGMAWLSFRWKTNYIWLAHLFQLVDLTMADSRS